MQHTHTKKPAHGKKPAHTNAKRGYSKHKRYSETAERVRYIVPKDRAKTTKSHIVTEFRNGDGSVPTLPSLITFEEAREETRARKLASDKAYQARIDAGEPPRKYSLRKQFLYNRNRRILEGAHAILVIQPGSDPEFYEIMAKLQGHWETAHFRNGLVHLQDKSYAKLKEFFKGPVRVLLQTDPTKTFGSITKLRRVLGEHPNTFFLGGAVDGFAGVAKDFEELKAFESKLHIQQQIIGALGGINQLIPVLDSAPKKLAQVMNHHGAELEKQQTNV